MASNVMYILPMAVRYFWGWHQLCAARYHSLIVAKENLPDELLVIAESADGEIMGLKHRDCNVFETVSSRVYDTGWH